MVRGVSGRIMGKFCTELEQQYKRLDHIFLKNLQDLIFIGFQICINYQKLLEISQLIDA